MKQKEKLKEKELDICTDLERCFRVYKVYEFIACTGECVVSEIKKIVDMKLNSIYRLIDKLEKRVLIKKDSTIEKRKNCARYTIVAMPELSLEVKKIRNLIVHFSNDVAQKRKSVITNLRGEKEKGKFVTILTDEKCVKKGES